MPTTAMAEMLTPRKVFLSRAHCRVASSVNTRFMVIVGAHDGKLNSTILNPQTRPTSGNVVVTLRVTDRSRTGAASSIRVNEGIGDHNVPDLDWLARRLV